MKQINKMKEYVKKNWKEMAKNAAVGVLAGGTVYVLYKLAGIEKVEATNVADYYKELDVPEFAKYIISEVGDSRKYHETMVVSQVIHLNELEDLGKKIVEAYDVNSEAPIVATISIAR